MAKIKYSALVSDMRNSLNGSTLSKNRYGNYIRNKVTPVNPQTSFQQSARQILGNLSSSFRELTLSQIRAWNNAGQDFPFTDIFGDIKHLTGQTLFVKLNANLEKVGSPRISVPPLPVGFPEISITDSTFEIGQTGAVTGTLELSSESIPDGYELIVYGTPGISRARSFVKNRFRFLGKFEVDEGVVDFGSALANRFGVPLVDELVHIKVALISTATGQQGVPLTESIVVSSMP